jgi:cytochrome c556
MQRLKNSVLGLMLALIALGSSGSGQESNKEEKKDKKKETVSDLMQKKLKNSQKVLEGIAMNDFDMIAKNADEIVQISRDTEWKVVKAPRYELFSDEFRGNAETLIKEAKTKNLDGAALAYVEMTLNCVKCHKYVREVRMTQLDFEKSSFSARNP